MSRVDDVSTKNAEDRLFRSITYVIVALIACVAGPAPTFVMFTTICALDLLWWAFCAARSVRARR
jgi:hypothetical protein